MDLDVNQKNFADWIRYHVNEVETKNSKDSMGLLQIYSVEIAKLLLELLNKPVDNTTTVI
jgi:hypothetical protein